VVALVVFLSKNTISLTEMKINSPAEILEFKALIFYLRVLKLRQEIKCSSVQRSFKDFQALGYLSKRYIPY
jgi:uncharacterized membrane protein YGL010W